VRSLNVLHQRPDPSFQRTAALVQESLVPSSEPLLWRERRQFFAKLLAQALGKSDEVAEATQHRAPRLGTIERLYSDLDRKNTDVRPSEREARYRTPERHWQRTVGAKLAICKMSFTLFHANG
jgi:hypothetical protein